jgi:alanyl-tRNA synthetase
LSKDQFRRPNLVNFVNPVKNVPAFPLKKFRNSVNSVKISVMTSSEIRASFLDFFKEKQHTIVPSSSLLPDQPDIPFTNAGMNQFVPIFLGQAPCPYLPARAADTQKCIRAGGKHNDLEDVGFDTYHHTFFEMLGNWSFGDYFKKEAIAWAWELVVRRWKFPASRIYATVYKPGPGDPASFDQEAYDQWAAIFTAAELDPAIHIVNGNKKDNFWMMGDTGPCGPCSELHVDLTPGSRDLDATRQKSGRELVNKGDARCIEIWNLVFIQFNAVVLRWEDQEIHPGIFKSVPAETRFDPLPKKHVDTGMGFERVVSMIQGTKGLTDFSEKVKISNYETDVFRPIFDKLEKITGMTYEHTLPSPDAQVILREKRDIAFRVIADHIRTLSFSIADGIQPSNEGRGYVIRRILRRAVKYGRDLLQAEPFLFSLVGTLANEMGDVFPELRNKRKLIEDTIRNEELAFHKTLKRGIELLRERLLKAQDVFGEAVKAGISENVPFPHLEAKDVFELYDTYGFPVDLTRLIAAENHVDIDVAGFEKLMEEQKARGKAAQKKEVITVEAETEDSLKPTVFYGYDELQSAALVVANEHGALAVTETPFYAEMGGQVGDAGEVEIAGKKVAVTNTVKSPSGKVYFHKLAEPVDAKSGDRVTLHVDEPRRARIEAHHSGTHLMNWALRKVLGNTITQKGSYVGPDRLRFDFSHGAAMTHEELAEVERLVNEKIEADVPVKWEERPYAEVKGDPSILQFFGDKYGDRVRVVSIGDFSKELCGGTHVRQSGKVGYFKILHEAAIAAGIRRIEAASGDALQAQLEELLRKQDEQLAHASEATLLPARLHGGAAATAESLPELWQRYKDREKLLHDMAAQRAQHEKDEAKRQEAAFQKRAAADAPALIASAATINDVPFLARNIVDTPAAYLPVLADALKSRWQGVAVLAAVDQGKVALLCAVAPAFTKKIQAGKIIQAIAPLVGGKGGGRPELAQGGGANPEGVAAALAKAEELVRG